MYSINVFTDIPVKYEDKRHIAAVPDFQEGQPTLTMGYSEKIEEKQASTSPVLVVAMAGQGGRFWVKYFHYNNWHLSHFQRGQRTYIWGTPTKDRNMWTFFHPSIPSEIGRIIPIYPPRTGETNTARRQNILEALHRQIKHIVDESPGELLARRDLPPIADAITAIHSPTEMPTRTHFLRLAYRELFTLNQRVMLHRRTSTAAIETACPPPMQEGERLPATQHAAILASITDDLKRNTPMKRLVTGDPHTGKKAMAAQIALAAMHAGSHVAILTTDNARAQAYRELLTPPANPNHAMPRTKTNTNQRQRIKIATIRQIEQIPTPDLLILDENDEYGPQQTDRMTTATVHCLQLTSAPIPLRLLNLYSEIVPTSVLTRNPTCQRPTTIISTRSSLQQIYPDIDDALGTGDKVVIYCPKVPMSHKDYNPTQSTLDLWQEKLSPRVLYRKNKSERASSACDSFISHQGPCILLTDEHPEEPISHQQTAILVINLAETFSMATLHRLRSLLPEKPKAPRFHLITHSEEDASELRAMETTNDPSVIAALDMRRDIPQGTSHNTTTGNPFALPSPSVYETVKPWVQEDIQTCIINGIIDIGEKDAQQAENPEVI